MADEINPDDVELDASPTVFPPASNGNGARNSYAYANDNVENDNVPEEVGVNSFGMPVARVSTASRRASGRARPSA